MLELIMELLDDVKEYGFTYRELEKETYDDEIGVFTLETLIFDDDKILYCCQTFDSNDDSNNYIASGIVGTIEDTPEYIESQCNDVWFYNAYPMD